MSNSFFFCHFRDRLLFIAGRGGGRIGGGGGGGRVGP